MALMNLENEREMVKTTYFSLHILTITAIASGLICWFFVPFLTDQAKNPKHQIVRILSLLYATGSGAVGVFGAKKLARLDKYVTAITKAEDNNFINTLATSQYANQKLMENESQAVINLAKAPEYLPEGSPEEDYEEPLPQEINGVKLQDYHWEVLDFAKQKGLISPRDLQRSGIGQRLTLNASTARDILSDLAKAELGKIEGEDEKIKFLPVS